MNKKKKNTFPGGIHPADGNDKQLSKDKAIIEYIPDFVEISMEQAPGARCEPVIAAGEEVKFGQLIGKPVTFTAANLHSGVDGIVVELKEKDCKDGSKETLCVIKVRKPEKNLKKPEYTRKLVSIEAYEREKILAEIQDGGLVGMGGAGFPSYIKYNTDKEIKTLLINGAECEPYLTCDYRLMMEQGYALVNGVGLLMKASGALEAVICVEDNKLDAANRLKEILKDCQEAIRVETVPTKYPQGGERQLMQTVLGLEVPKGGLPADISVIVSNVATAKAAADILFGGQPLVSRVVTVSGEVARPGNFLVPLGTRIEELISQTGGVTLENNRVILGGPMTGTCIAAPYKKGSKLPGVSKTTSGIVVLKDTDYRETPCIKCGACRQICPAGISPFQIDFAMIRNDYALCEELYASECIACGSCTFVCPARRELAFRTISARNMVRQNMRERGKKN